MFQNVVSMVSSIAYRRSGTCRNIIALLNIIYDEECSSSVHAICLTCHCELISVPANSTNIE
ncbi:hypothetical protein T09_6461 [Trichinella sp. T9]|nr:hypothetical protein T09_6461 [Trichinella sp. T9]